MKPSPQVTTIKIPLPAGTVNLLDPQIILRMQARGFLQNIQEAGRYAPRNPAEARLAEQRLQDANRFFDEHPDLLEEMQNPSHLRPAVEDL
jgi:hypothetical protein